MNRPCAIEITCEGQDAPILNLSSESADPVVFFSLVFPRIPTDCATLDQTFWPLCPLAVCESEISQLDADLCAFSSACNCGPITGTPPPPGSPIGPPPPPVRIPNPPVFFNDEQTCSVCCADCSTWSYTIPANKVTGRTPEEANLLAHNLACYEARKTLTCPGTTITVLPNATKDQAYVDALFGGCGTAIGWAVYSGSLPPGLTINPVTGVISGTPTVAGSYNFTLLVQTI